MKKTATPGCTAQTYWYENGVQRGAYCEKDATTKTRAMDGSINRFCDEHAAGAISHGADEVTA